MFLPTLEALARASLPQGRVVIEKPFGEDLASAQALNRLLHQSFPENAVFRIDHFLHLQTVQNVLGLRFANRIVEQLWNRDHVERVEIVWDESLTLEGRASYYDRAGALKDMIQNHLLQLLCLVGMEAPLTLDERTLRDRKIDVLRAVRRLSPEEVEQYTVRARYTAGRIGERQVPSYADEEGIDPARGTETFAQVTLWVDNWRWAGVPFVLRSGKAWAESGARSPCTSGRCPIWRSRQMIPAQRAALDARPPCLWHEPQPPRRPVPSGAHRAGVDFTSEDCRPTRACCSRSWRGTAPCPSGTTRRRSPGGSSRLSSMPGPRDGFPSSSTRLRLDPTAAPNRLADNTPAAAVGHGPYQVWVEPMLTTGSHGVERSRKTGKSPGWRWCWCWRTPSSSLGAS